MQLLLLRSFTVLLFSSLSHVLFATSSYDEDDVVGGKEQQHDDRDDDHDSLLVEEKVEDGGRRRRSNKIQDIITEGGGEGGDWPYYYNNNNFRGNNNENNKEHDESNITWNNINISNLNNKKPPCRNYTSCNTCSDASWCHWCDRDEACHVMGSWYGCVSGSSCQPKPTPPLPPPNERNDTSGCFAHRTCADCTLHRLCHWCAHDNACHAKGSVYGCVTGVDCYSNDRCMRKEPEPIDDVVFTKIGYAPLAVIFALSCLALCCSSLCCCAASGIKGAYDDLAHIAAATDTAAVVVESTPPSSLRHQMQQPLLSRGGAAAASSPEGGDEAAAETTTPERNTEETNPDSETSALVESEQGHAVADNDDGGGDDDDDDGYVHLVEGSDDEADDSYSRRRRPLRHMQRLYNACVTCYLLNIVGIAVFAFAAIRYYPKIPEYNVCNDSMAWKSLIENLAEMKATADFQILASISNPNHFDVALDMGHGQFTHHQMFVGTFDIPPVTVQSMSITDLLIIAHLSPDKWDALSLTKDFYENKLVLHVDAQAKIRIPVFANYSYAADLKDIVVHVNLNSDRHLCACPNWADAKNNTPNFLTELPQKLLGS